MNIRRLIEFSYGLIPFLFIFFIVITSIYYTRVAAIVLIIYGIFWIFRLTGYLNHLTSSFHEHKHALDSKWKISGGKVTQAVIIATLNEPYEILSRSIEAIAKSNWDKDKLIILIAYEERGGKNVEKQVLAIEKKYGSQFKLLKAIKHPGNMPGEAKAKAGNISYAAKYLTKYCQDQKIDPKNVLVTTMDADSVVHPNYFLELASAYLSCDKPQNTAYQPAVLFSNNIWEATALNRVVAWDTSFWLMIDFKRRNRLRLFSAYAQSLYMLEEVDYWNVKTVVEDGHQYWRYYFGLRGEFKVKPLYLPIYEDAVTGRNILSSTKSQFRQLLRWAWSAADTPYIITESIKDKSISWRSKTMQIIRQVDDYISWSTTPIIFLITAWLPFLFEPKGLHSNLFTVLLYIVLIIQALGIADTLQVVFVSMSLLPKRPDNIKPAKRIAMALQWLLEPFVLIFLVSVTSLIAHGRLVIGKPLEKFHATEKSIT